LSSERLFWTKILWGKELDSKKVASWQTWHDIDIVTVCLKVALSRPLTESITERGVGIVPTGLGRNESLIRQLSTGGDSVPG
jgi:hypothetical protein